RADPGRAQARQLRRQFLAGRREQRHLGHEGRLTMISRVADHCFWFGRYIARAEAPARVLAASVSLAPDAELPPALVWRRVVVVSGEEARFASRHAADDSGDDESPAWGDGELVQRFMVWDEDSGVSLTRSIQGMRWNARSI